MIFDRGPNWIPDEVSAYSEAAERYRTTALASTFTAELTGDQLAKVEAWQDAQRSLWDAALERRRRSRPPSWSEFELEGAEQSRWLTIVRSKHAVLKDVPRAFQDNLLGRLDGSLRSHYFSGGGEPQPWKLTTLEFPLLRVTGGPRNRHVRALSELSVRLPKLGPVQLQGDEPLPAACEVVRVHLAPDAGQWRALVYWVDKREGHDRK